MPAKKPSTPCTRTRLAAATIGNVDACTCGMIHLNLGATTLRFTPEAFRLLARMVGDAVREEATNDPRLPAEAGFRLGEPVRGEA